ncbi:MAG: hypothetical protein K6F59_02155 [Gammaproteobacteria bacterium]|nr:hypothetical protein [Gammaproteobacteria bacterium]
MAKRKDDTQKEEQLADYYELKTEAAEELAKVYTEEEKKELDKKTEVKPGEKRPYKVDFFARIPASIKVIFAKYWTFGVICYFFYWGLGYYISNLENLTLIVGLATGIIMDIFVTSAFLHFESDKKEFHPYLLVPVPFKKIWSFPINIVVYTGEAFGVYGVYYLINRLIELSKGLEPGTAPLSVEPLLYGLIALFIDAIIIAFKDLIIFIIRRLKNSIKAKNNGSKEEIKE